MGYAIAFAAGLIIGGVAGYIKGKSVGQALNTLTTTAGGLVSSLLGKK